MGSQIQEYFWSEKATVGSAWTHQLTQRAIGKWGIAWWRSHSTVQTAFVV